MVRKGKLTPRAQINILLTNTQFTGLLVALSGIFVVYILPRMVPSFRSIIGMPGV